MHFQNRIIKIPKLIFNVTIWLYCLNVVDAEDEFHSEIREIISQWAQTLKEIQTAEEDWKSESLLLEGQKESLAAEEVDLKNSIKLAKEERDSSDKDSVELVNKKKKLEDVTKLIDSEIKSIIDSCYERAENLLKTNLDKLNVMADALLKYETIDESQIDDIMAGAEPREPKGWSDDEPKPKSNKKTSIKGAAEEL